MASVGAGGISVAGSGVEGYSGGRWILIDLGDVIVHAFVPEERDLYKLERLWGDAPIVLKIE